MDIHKLEYLAKRYFNNTITDEEQRELAALIQKAKTDVPLKRVLQETWKTYEPAQQMPDDMSSRILSNLFTSNSGSVIADRDHITTPAHNDTVSFNRDKPMRSIPVWKYTSIAASVALIFSITWWLSNKKVDGEKPTTHTISTQKGARSKAELPDGTIVWLNAGSLLEYDDDYGKSFRKVSLTGEAFFDVTHNKEKPFIIHTTAIELKVLGTTFNVRAYPEEKRTEAALITGVLEVSLANLPSQKIVLKPAEKISVNNEKNTLDSTQVQSTITDQKNEPGLAVSSVTYLPSDSSVIETSWVHNKLVFRNKPFEEVALELSRWYNVNFEIHDKMLMTKRFTGTFETETIYEALTRLSESYNFWFMYDAKKKLFIIDK
jgi:transmembrane sensor